MSEEWRPVPSLSFLEASSLAGYVTVGLNGYAGLTATLSLFKGTASGANTVLSASRVIWSAGPQGRRRFWSTA